MQGESGTAPTHQQSHSQPPRAHVRQGGDARRGATRGAATARAFPGVCGAGAGGAGAALPPQQTSMLVRMLTECKAISPLQSWDIMQTQNLGVIR